MWWVSVTLTLCLMLALGRWGRAEAAGTHLGGELLCVKCWWCLQHGSVLQCLTWRVAPRMPSVLMDLQAGWSTVPRDSGPAPGTLQPSLLPDFPQASWLMLPMLHSGVWLQPW